MWCSSRSKGSEEEVTVAPVARDDEGCTMADLQKKVSVGSASH